MKTTKQVIEESGLPPKLVRSVIRQLGGKDSLNDVCNHGADCGFNGFIYYTDTVSFYYRNKTDIIDLLKDQVDSIGYDSVISMVKSFNCLRDSTEEEISKTLYGPKSKHDTSVANGLAWFALEEVARAFCDY